MKILPREQFDKLHAPLAAVTINNLFARAVVEKKITGTVFVDDTENPSTFYIVHPYCMTLLFGKSDNRTFNLAFKEHALNTNGNRTSFEWMQAFPESWDAVLLNLFEDKLIRSAENTAKQETGVIELNTRVNFQFSLDKYLEYKNRQNNLGKKAVKTDRTIFRAMKGSVVPEYFCDSEDDFINNGIGFSIFYNGQLASTAYSSCIFDNVLELGIETIPQFRGKGLAEQSCSALIDYCIEHNYEPVWACRLENTGSYKLAQKLGFVPSITIPYYRLSK